MIVLKKIEQILYLLRDSIWEYPIYFFEGQNSFSYRIRQTYKATRPFSHIFSFSFVIVISAVLLANNASAVLRINSNTLIEGVIVGVDESNNLQKLNRVNPLINTNIQLEKELSELIYESLITVDQDGEIHAVMADFLSVENGRLYRFKLKEGLVWQDGKPITTRDVEATFKLVRNLENDAKTRTLYSKVVNKIELDIIDEQSFEVKLNGSIPALFEALSFKILPAHLITDLNPLNISSSDPFINRNPLGSGPYRLVSVGENTIELRRNELYHGESSAIETIVFKLFQDEDLAVDALKSGQIHSLTGISTESLRELQNLDYIKIHGSNVIFNQYWGIYFNLKQAGPSFFKDKDVRRAISSAIDRNFIIQDLLLGYAKEAFGPIPVNSYAYSSNKYYDYNKNRAERLLDDAGWTIPEGKTIREKDGEVMSFELVLIDNPDRVEIAESIRQDLADIGIEVNLLLENRDALVNEHIITRKFETLLFGVQTFIDPDRFELFHSSQIEHPGLNIGSYKSEANVLTVIEGQTKRIPLVDDSLDDARKIVEDDGRVREYQVFQDVIADEVPLVFLFHPIETYAVNKRVKGIDLKSINSIEQRFNSIQSWEIRLD